MLYYPANQKEDINLLEVAADIISGNGMFSFPIITAVYFSTIIVNEFKQETIKTLFSSTKYRGELFIGKFLGAVTVFSVIFIVLLMISILVTSLIINPQHMAIEFYALTYKETILRISIVTILTLLFLICLGSYVFMIGTITESQGFTIFYLLLTIFLHLTLLGITPFLSIHSVINVLSRKYSFMRGLFFSNMLLTYNIFWTDILREILVFLTYTTTFIQVGIHFFKKKQV